MSAGASLRAEAVSVDFPVYDANTRSLRRRIVYHGTGGRVGRDAGNRLSVRALDNVSLAFEHGDRVGVVGPNGAGKTTLLRVLAGVYEPERGRVRRVGRTASLLNFALGIDNNATGYENIVTRGLLLGLDVREIRERVDEIAAFAELGDYLAMPARTYSQGMRFRLGFAVSTCFEPEILLMDEWMSVSDRGFLEKARRRIEEYAFSTGILVVAGHDADSLRRFCSKGVLLDAGSVAATGSIDEVLRRL